MKILSPLWTSEDLRAATKGTLKAEIEAFGVSIDTRQIKKNDLFIALLGHNSDGHRFIKQALEQGASAVMAHDRDFLTKENLIHDPRILLVKDTMKALEDLGQFARNRFKGRTIAITGSVGKTTTKEMLRQILGAYGLVHASVASFNNHWGVPLTLARLPREADFCISEIGMNHAGEITPLVAQVRPDCAIITVIGSAHIGYMGSQEAIALEKAHIFERLNPDHSTAIIAEDANYEEILKRFLPANTTLWHSGFSDKAELHISQLNLSDTGSTFLFSTPHQKEQVTLSVPGEHFVRNAAQALGVVASFNLDLAPSIKALKNFVPEAGRGQTKLINETITLIDESYNASPESIRAALKSLSLKPASRHLVALGDMLELGDYAHIEHTKLAASLIDCQALTFCCGVHMKALYEILPPSLQGGYAESAKSLLPVLQKTLKPFDVLLVKGSLGSRMKDLIEGLENNFSSIEKNQTEVRDTCSSI
ncbi:UDP-N-acetylmuramoyl-tripeptide--D-alanyl-D-alanine ligase [Aristophania vespae]|uniref:UDP-N-acetylmuramoyl-tripeptide--D-alanyl-D- alanine ligase n=1 Tax=Aristophania vespae TaxID=2697033 RepID=UPI0023514D13|nr:UDP-N-acetylmuramoyl-tripeptide--D-alanyl-D-alanine ligase [Aristophania vespae]UMM63442.1 UDP-N-acetylmuramoyl-tripeptide--D-alanyl-D-alanine ligase [Aristophania vespae]